MSAYVKEKLEDGHAREVRNGYLPERCFFFKYILFVVLISGYGIVCAQSHETILKLEPKGFKILLEKSPELASKDLWEFFIHKAEVSFNRKNYKTALKRSEKARIIAGRIKGDFVLYATHRQLGKIAFFRSEPTKAHRHFRWATNYLKRGIQSNYSGAPALTPEDAYLFYYWGYVFSDPSLTNSYLDFALSRLARAYDISKAQRSNEYDDVYTKTSLHLARVFGMKGHHVAKLLWIENAKLRCSEYLKNRDEIQFQISYESLKAMHRIGNYAMAEQSIYRIEVLKERLSLESQLRYLEAMVNFNGNINKVKQKHIAIDAGIDLARRTNSIYHLASFYIDKMLQLFLDKNTEKAKQYLHLLEEIKKKEAFSVNEIVIYLAKAVIASHEGNISESEKYFDAAENVWVENYGREWKSGLFFLGWKAETKLFQKDYKNLKLVGERYLDLALKVNVKNGLPFIYIMLARAHLGLGNIKEARRLNRKAVVLIESKRKASSHISTGVFEHLFEAYQLETTFNLFERKITGAFLASDKIKGRWLNDRIAGNLLNQKATIDSKLKNEIFDLTLEIIKKPENKSLFVKLSALEKKALSIEDQNERSKTLLIADKRVMSKLENSLIGEHTAIVSYTFTSENRLVAFVWQRNKALEAKQLEMSRQQADRIAENLPNKIKNSIFFKRDGKRLYDMLLGPLDLEAKHLIIVPDKSLWRIPFQALSEDGQTYLIESKQITYAPSVSILLQQLDKPKPARRSFQVFSNSVYNNRYLKFADDEAKSLAALYSVKPGLNTSEPDFRSRSDDSDIVHFSMHAEVDRGEPFKSFLGFRPVGKDDGKLTVEELLKIRMKQGSLVFLASCDTTNVFNGEGLVSLAWGMMAAGSSTVISAQWEANDRSTARFTESFYKHLKSGLSSSESLQKASVELINDKSANLSAPYYWAEFTLLGDYR